MESITETIISCNYDIHKIIVKITKSIDEAIKSCQNDIEKYDRKLELLKKQERLFEEYKSNPLERLICRLVLHNLRFYSKIASHKVTNSVVTVIDIGYKEMFIKNEESQSYQQELRQIIECQEVDGKTKDNCIEKHAAMLISAYINLQKQKFKQAMDILNKLEVIYNLSNVSNSANDLIEDIQRFGFIESIFTFQTLQYIYKDNDEKVKVYLEMLNELQNKIKDHHQIIAFQEMNQRLHRNIILFTTQYHFMKKEFEKATKTFKLLNQDEIEESLLIYFVNPSQDSFKNTLTIYYNSFGENFFKIFCLLQEISTEEMNEHVFQQLRDNFQQQQYQYGRGVVLLLLVIHSSVLRKWNKNYLKSVNEMKQMYELCKITNTNFSPNLKMFFDYQKLVPYLFHQISQKQKRSYHYNETNYFHTNINKVFEVYKNKIGYVLKKQRRQNPHSIVNEGAIQMLISHRHIQKVYDIFRDQSGNIILVQVLQGKNLKSLLGTHNISQRQRQGYIIQILNALSHLDSVNVIHSDLKLENILTQKEDHTKIKITDFGFSLLNLFNRYAKLLGNTPGYCPKKDGKIIDKKSDLYSLGKVIKELLTPKNGQIQFLISKQLNNVISSMLEEDHFQRPSINQVIHKIKLEFFFFNIFEHIQSTDNLVKHESYQEFIDYMHYKFELFIAENDNTFCFNELKQQNIYQEAEKIFTNDCIRQSIESLAQDQNLEYLFVDCLLDADIEQFSKIEFKVNSQLLKDQTEKLIILHSQEDHNSKNDIHPKYQEDFIDMKLSPLLQQRMMEEEEFNICDKNEEDILGEEDNKNQNEKPLKSKQGSSQTMTSNYSSEKPQLYSSYDVDGDEIEQFSYQLKTNLTSAGLILNQQNNANMLHERTFQEIYQLSHSIYEEVLKDIKNILDDHSRVQVKNQQTKTKKIHKNKKDKNKSFLKQNSSRALIQSDSISIYSREQSQQKKSLQHNSLNKFLENTSQNLNKSNNQTNSNSFSMLKHQFIAPNQLKNKNSNTKKHLTISEINNKCQAEDSSGKMSIEQSLSDQQKSEKKQQDQSSEIKLSQNASKSSNSQRSQSDMNNSQFCQSYGNQEQQEYQNSGSIINFVGQGSYNISSNNTQNNQQVQYNDSNSNYNSQENILYTIDLPQNNNHSQNIQEMCG